MTVSGNSSGAQAGGVWGLAGGTSLRHSTVTGNAADTGFNTVGGGGVRSEGGNATLTLRSTIVAGNRDATPGPGGADCSGPVSSAGFNLIGATAGCGYSLAGGDRLNIGPRIGPLADNGGGTFTHALLKGSPAIDNGGGGCPGTDQRRALRRGRCDIGAHERVLCLNGVVDIVGTPFRDSLTGTRGRDVFMLYGGNDVARGASGKDRICGGGGKEILFGGPGADKLAGSRGVDRLIGGRGRDKCTGGRGKDRPKGCETLVGIWTRSVPRRLAVPAGAGISPPPQ